MNTRHLVLALGTLADARAWAQQGPVPDAPAAQIASDTSAVAAAQARTLDAVIVTSQHREENVQKVPLAVSVVDGTALQRRQVTDIGGLPRLVPSVSFAAGNELRNSSIRIRGVGTDVFSTGVEPSIATVVDDVVLQRPGASFAELYDIERIEVLRGPQGTLFGKNASAGVISVVTQAPDFDGTSGNASLLLAQDDEQRFDGAVSAPLGDTFAYRLAGFAHTRGGNVENLYSGRRLNGADSWGLRGKLAWRSPDQRSQVTLTLDHARLNADCCALPLVVASNNPRAVDTGTPVGPDNTEVNNDVDPFVRQTNQGAALTARIALGDYSLTSISAWRRFDNDSDMDLDDTDGRFILHNHNIERSRTLTQELRLASPTGGRFDYVLGAFWFDGSVYNSLDRRGLNLPGIASVLDDGNVVPVVPGDQAVLAGHSRVDSHSGSLFAHGNWHLSDRLTLGGGLRFIDERQRLDFVRPLAGRFNGVLQAPTNPAFGPVTGHYDDTATIGKLSLSYEMAATVTGYVGYSTGYKGEGLASTLGLSAEQFARLPAPAETSRLLEAGLKSTLFDGALMLDTTLFRTRIQDYQAQTFDSTSGLFLLTSAGGVAIDGLEVEFTARPSTYFSLVGGFTWLDARFDGVSQGPCYTGQTLAQGCRPVGHGASAQDLDGKPFINAPRWRVLLSARYDAPLSARLDGYVQADWRWQDNVVLDISQNPNLRQDAYGVADLSAGLIFGDGRYDLGVFVKNLFDQAYAANLMAVGTAGGANAYAQQLPRDFHRYAGVNFRMVF
ncbi:MAG TPA: TonB-dependent receptor [Stenotrophomonas sp.]|nr:TonB-dependent receptor [Stenotrophomonas sp.]